MYRYVTSTTCRYQRIQGTVLTSNVPVDAEVDTVGANDGNGPLPTHQLYLKMPPSSPRLLKPVLQIFLLATAIACSIVMPTKYIRNFKNHASVLFLSKNLPCSCNAG
jgi:hypothetical protein